MQVAFTIHVNACNAKAQSWYPLDYLPEGRIRRIITFGPYPRPGKVEHLHRSMHHPLCNAGAVRCPVSCCRSAFTSSSINYTAWDAIADYECSLEYATSSGTTAALHVYM